MTDTQGGSVSSPGSQIVPMHLVWEGPGCDDPKGTTKKKGGKQTPGGKTAKQSTKKKSSGKKKK